MFSHNYYQIISLILIIGLSFLSAIIFNCKDLYYQILKYRIQLSNVKFWNFWNQEKIITNKYYNGIYNNHEFIDNLKKLHKKYNYVNNKSFYKSDFNIPLYGPLTDEEADKICAQIFINKNKYIWLLVKRNYYKYYLPLYRGILF